MVTTAISNTMRGARRWQGPALVAAAGLAASYFYVRAKTRQAERAFPPQGKFIEVDGVELHYLEHGHGPPVLLLHGNATLANDFDLSRVSELAARHYRVIAFDRPGFGYSERPRTTIWTPMAQARLLHAALLKLGIESPIVLGHSWGTLVAMSMAIAYPEQVRGLVLLGGYFYPSARIDTLLMAPRAIPLIGDLLSYTLSPLLGRLMWRRTVRKMFHPREVPERFQAIPPWMMLRPSQLRASAGDGAMMVASAIKLSRHYKELKMPVRILAGMEDRIADPNAQSVRLHRSLANSELHVEPGTGHMIHYARPDEVVAAIDEAAAPQVPKPSRMAGVRRASVGAEPARH